MSDREWGYMKNNICKINRENEKHVIKEKKIYIIRL